MMAPFHRDAVARQAALMADIAAENIAGWPVDDRSPWAEDVGDHAGGDPADGHRRH